MSSTGWGKAPLASEEWVTTKKVEIVTTKNVERKIQRQLVLEDGRVMEEEIPTVTVDTTTDKQTFETDQDEERNLVGDGNSFQTSRFDTSGGVLVGDKFIRIKKINDVRENLVKTEAMQNIGDIATSDVFKALDAGDDVQKYLRRREDQDQQVSINPRIVSSSSNHKVITDKEDVRERNWVNKGKMQNERIRTEEHIEYDSADSPDEGSSSSSSKSSHHRIEPEIYKTRKDENFTEYYKTAWDNNNKLKAIKVGDGPHYVSESKEEEREYDNHLREQSFHPIRAEQMPRHLLAEADANDRRNRKPVNRTDSWLERHFGSTSTLSASSTELSIHGSGEGYGLRRSASICDIRPVNSSSNVYYATVRKSGKVPEVKLREKLNKSDYAANRVSANFSSTGQPVRPPRKTKKSEFKDQSYSISNQKPDSDPSKDSFSSYKRTQSAHVTERYYFGNPQTVKQDPGGLNKNYSSLQTRSARPEHHQSAGNIYKVIVRQEEPQLLSSMQRESNHVRNSSGDHYLNKKRETRDAYQPRSSARDLSKQRYPGDIYQLRKSSGEIYTRKQRGPGNTNHVRKRSGQLNSSEQSVPKNNAYSSRQRVSGDADQDRSGLGNAYSSIKPNKERDSAFYQDKIQNDRNIYRDQPRARKPYPSNGEKYSSEAQEKSAIYSTPHRIIYTMDAPVRSPSTKYRTRIVINGDGL